MAGDLIIFDMSHLNQERFFDFFLDLLFETVYASVHIILNRLCHFNLKSLSLK